jgi:hypothetical protein
MTSCGRMRATRKKSWSSLARGRLVYRIAVRKEAGKPATRIDDHPQRLLEPLHEEL